MGIERSPGIHLRPLSTLFTANSIQFAVGAHWLFMLSTILKRAGVEGKASGVLESS